MIGLKSWSRLLLLLLAAVVAGCSVPALPDPNDPGRGANVDPDVLKRNLKWASDFLNDRVARGEITNDEAKTMLRQTADKLVRGVDLGQVEANEYWQYGEFFRAAGHWEEAKQALEYAVKHAKNEDRRVNDTLRLSQTNAMLGDVEEAIRLARTVFDAKPEDTAPVLPAVLLEIVPAAKGKGHDVELARLLEDAIAIHEKTVVDPSTEAGKAFLVARVFHIRNAWATVVRLYRASGNDALAEQAIQKSGESANKTIRL